MPENSESSGKCWEDRDTVVAVCGVTHSKPSLSCGLEIGWKLAETVGTEPDTVRGAVPAGGRSLSTRVASRTGVLLLLGCVGCRQHHLLTINTVADKQYRL